MKLSDKIMFVLILLICLSISTLNFVGMINPSIFLSFTRNFEIYDAVGGFLACIIDIAISVGLFYAVCRLAYAVFRNRRDEEALSSRNKYIAVTDKSNPESVHVYIIGETLEQIAKKSVLSQRTVAECRADLIMNEAKDNCEACFNISIIPTADADIPALANDIKKSVTEAITTQTKLKVGTVDVYVYPASNKRMRTNIY